MRRRSGEDVVFSSNICLSSPHMRWRDDWYHQCIRGASACRNCAAGLVHSLGSQPWQMQCSVWLHMQPPRQPCRVCGEVGRQSRHSELVSPAQGRWAAAGSGSVACARCRRCTTAWCTAWAAGRTPASRMSWQTARCARCAPHLRPRDHACSGRIALASSSQKRTCSKGVRWRRAASAGYAACFHPDFYHMLIRMRPRGRLSA